MTQPEEQNEHDALQQLFDDTASQASGPTLTKLSARAADIPQSARQKPGILPRWAWAPLFGGVVVTAGALLALRATRPKFVEPQGSAVASAMPSAALASTALSTAEVSARPPGPLPNEEIGEAPELLGDADEGAHFDVAGPASDRDLDAWLAATKDLSGGT